MPEHDVRVRHPRAHQAQPGAEGEVVDDHGIRAHPLDEVVHLPGHADRVPEQVVAAGAGLELQGGHGALAGGLEEAAQRVVLARGLLLGADDARVRAAAELEVLALVAELAHHRVGGGPVATTTRSPASRQAVARVASG